MKQAVFLLAVFCSLFSIQKVAAQPTEADHNSISIQPIILLQNLMPYDAAGFSVQYETALSSSGSLLGRTAWFENPLFVGGSSIGYAASFEYRHYYSTTATGWHVGGMLELVRYKGMGYQQVNYGSTMRNTFDIGVVAGHKWINGAFVFDASVRVSRYLSDVYPDYNLDLPVGKNGFNSMMLLSVGYSFN